MIVKKHTPSPWVAFKKHKYNEWHVSVPIAGISTRLALFDEGIRSDNQEADARLIAAAPELLEALEGLLHSICNSECGEMDRKLAVVDARTAIAKATGVQS